MIHAGAAVEKNIKSAMGNKELFQKVKDFRLPIGEYALFGSAPLGIRRLKECLDIDVIVTEDLWNECKNKNWEVRRASHGSEYLWNNEIETIDPVILKGDMSLLQ